MQLTTGYKKRTQLYGVVPAFSWSFDATNYRLQENDSVIWCSPGFFMKLCPYKKYMIWRQVFMIIPVQQSSLREGVLTVYIQSNPYWPPLEKWQVADK